VLNLDFYIAHPEKVQNNPALQEAVASRPSPEFSTPISVFPRQKATVYGANPSFRSFFSAFSRGTFITRHLAQA
jgi:hypothetical protein